jgi:hypothetical protein
MEFDVSHTRKKNGHEQVGETNGEELTYGWRKIHNKKLRRSGSREDMIERLAEIVRCFGM